MTAVSRNTLVAGGLLAVASSAMFTGKVIVAKLAYARGLDPAGLVLLRMVFSSPVYCFILLYELRRNAKVTFSDGSKALLLGLLGYFLSTTLDFWGIQYISTALERMILQLSPSIVMLIGVFFMREKIDLRLLMAMALGYAGVTLMVRSELGGAPSSGHAANALWGVALVGGATLVYAMYVMGAERMMRRVQSGIFTSLGMIGASVGVFIFYAFDKGFVAPTHDTGALGLGLVMAVFCTLIPSYMVNQAIHMIGGARMGPFNYVGMGLTFVVSAWLLDESFPPEKLAGIFFAMAGALALTLGKVGARPSKRDGNP
jgi:drug/metabolite transporter (DMT)-like permease